MEKNLVFQIEFLFYINASLVIIDIQCRGGCVCFFNFRQSPFKAYSPRPNKSQTRSTVLDHSLNMTYSLPIVFLMNTNNKANQKTLVPGLEAWIKKWFNLIF